MSSGLLRHNAVSGAGGSRAAERRRGPQHRRGGVAGRGDGAQGAGAGRVAQRGARGAATPRTRALAAAHPRAGLSASASAGD